MAANEEVRKRLVLSRVRRVQRRLNQAVWWEAGVLPLWCVATAGAAWHLGVRIQQPWAVAVFAALASVWWVRRARRSLHPLGAAAVAADRLAGAGGLLL